MKIRRKIHDITLGEQDPGKDLFAVLFFVFLMLLSVQIAVISSGGKEEVPKNRGGSGNQILSDKEIAFAAKQNGEIVFIVADQTLSKEKFFESITSLPVWKENGGVKYINLEARDNSLGAKEWDQIKVDIRKRGFGVNPVVSAEDK
jgi:hypothetical protein